jgi:translation initiation factor IF-2
MARRRRIIAAAALVCTSALVPLQAPRPRRTVSRYSEAVDEDTLLPSGDAAAAADTDRRPRNGNRQNQGGGRGRIIQLSNPMRLVRKQRPGGDRRAPPGGQRRGGPPQRVGSTGEPVADVPNPDKAPGRRFANKADKPDYDKRKPTRRTFDAPQRRSGNNRPVQFRGARGSLKRKRNRDDREAKQKEAIKPVIVPDEPISVGALAELLEKSGAEVVKHLMLKMGVLAAVTQNVDGATARLVVEGFGREWAASADEVDEDDEDDEGTDDSGPALALSSGIAIDEDDPDSLQPRSPVVTIMGHVDHGKTSLLDALREADVVSGEAGGITQGIGAYVVPVKDRSVTFIDTPGHAAFTEMRERGANVTDIVVLVVAADDGCKEQTVDSLACAKLAGAPVVVAVNKMDVEGADAQRVEGELMSYDLVPESAGGDTLVARVSAKEKTGLDELLEKVLLQADLLDLRANPDRAATGTVIEAGVEKGPYLRVP